MCQWSASQHRRRRGSAQSKHGQQTVESLNDGETAHESRVSMVVSKRLRNAKKRLGKIREIQRKEARGEELNDDQRVALGHAVGQELLVEELEKMSTVLDDAVKEERREAVAEKEEWMREAMKQSQAALEKAVRSVKKDQKGFVEEARREGMVKGVERVIELLYLAGLFDPFIPYQVEKHAVLQGMGGESPYGVKSAGEMLDMIGVLGKMMTSRPLGEIKSHEDALRQCQDVALAYAMGKDDCVLGWNGCMTKEQVETMVGRVKALEYFTAVDAFTGPLPMEQQDVMYYGAPQEHSVVAPLQPPPPPPPPIPAPPMSHHVAGYISPREAAVSGENVLSQFFGSHASLSNTVQQPVVRCDSASLGLQEVSTAVKEDGGEERTDARNVLVSKNTVDIPVQNQGQKKMRQKNKKRGGQGKQTPSRTSQGDQGHATQKTQLGEEKKTKQFYRNSKKKNAKSMNTTEKAG